MVPLLSAMMTSSPWV